MDESRIVAIPEIALSIRQPWAWAVVEGFKDVENRSWQAVNNGLKRRGRIAVHAAKGMTQDEYFNAAAFMRECGVTCPLAADLERGGIIGAVDVIDVVKASKSPWFFHQPGNRGLLLANPARCKFTPAVGSLGYFRWLPMDPPVVPEPATWMLRKKAAVPSENPGLLQHDMFSEAG